MLQGRNSNNYNERLEAIVEASTGAVYICNFVWDINTLSWVRMTGSGASQAGPSDGVVLDMMLDEPNPNETYVGEALPGTSIDSPGWRLKKISKSGTITAIKYANGTSAFDKVWSQRIFYNY